jgi:predicted TIM-barrel fold metal-dependent hydrolase
MMNEEMEYPPPSLEIAAIDVHAHYGDYTYKGTGLESGFQSGDAATVAERAEKCNVELTVVSPLLGLFPRGKADAVAGNEEAVKVVPQTNGLLQWVIINPLQPQTYDQAREMLALPHCVGIKIHPVEHQYPITEHGEAIFKFAAEQKAVVLTHSGDEFSWPDEFIPFANAFPEVSLILAHLGNGGLASGRANLQVEAIKMIKHERVYVDTSSARSIMPRLIEWSVGEIGAERLLFGTDTPLYFTAFQRARIDYAEIPLEQKRCILRDNAIKLLNLESIIAAPQVH